ncbi:MAG: hypothetical protein IJU41_06490 [Clostridia bacterium]|nr:hypothetical protein [Clostridia bacterium]
MSVGVILLLAALLCVEALALLTLRRLLAACGALPKPCARVHTRHLSVHRKAIDAYKAKREA